MALLESKLGHFQQMVAVDRLLLLVRDHKLALAFLEAGNSHRCLAHVFVLSRLL